MHLLRSAVYSTDPGVSPAEDYELWSRLLKAVKMAELPEPLVVYREVSGSISRNTSFGEKIVKICPKIWLM